jgi:hypothetical protein
MKIIALLIILFTSRVSQAYQLHLIDGVSGLSLSNTKVIITRENTIRCGSAPCPSNEIKFDRVTDQQGVIDTSTIYSKENLGGDFYLSISQYHPIRVPRVLNSKGMNNIEVIPLKIDSTFRQITFIDKISNKPLANLDVSFSRTEEECKSGVCKNIILREKTNRLGHIYYKFLMVFPGGLAEMNPVLLQTEYYLPYVRHHHHTGTVELFPKKMD